MPLKRTNWTTEEVIELLKGQRVCFLDGKPDYENFQEYNSAINSCVNMFADFKRPETESGAMAYNTDDKVVYHIGPRLPR